MSRSFLFGVVGVVVLLGAAFAAWRYYTGSSTSTSPLIVETSSKKENASEASASLPQDVQEAARRITRELEILRTLKELDVKFFEDPRLGALVQTPVDVPPAYPVARMFSLTPLGRVLQQALPSPTPQPKPRGL